MAARVDASDTYSVTVPAGRYTLVGHSPLYWSGRGVVPGSGDSDGDQRAHHKVVMSAAPSGRAELGMSPEERTILMIEVRGLTKRYGAKTAVDGLTFGIEPGKVTGFLGPNGADKPVSGL